ncbi:MFS transporter [Lentilactobacillus kisonensis]|uniref:Transporter, major facilitator family protein n=1 Tax=Lentilactobacillus kisonensis DSM 19906 = JCM 15041 TaxID=1423766 RepID=A0A0R1NM01_9LACO|nr:MFS transporter [Lentilactobacillus kisonensis]KRL21238.1 transporter, major facilitator family protein [Lentilactobacillus kisonensis DSM 19906 = JCM 15041]
MSSNANVDSNTASAQALLANDTLPWHRKITYGFTDMSGNLLYCIISSYMLYFFTNVFGLSVGTAGVLLLIGRIFDAIGAPVMGILVDHTHSKYGKSRPWFLWMSLPFAIFVWLLFTTPALSGTLKVVYAGVMYILADLSYTAMSTPITSVLPNLTSSTDGRMQANSIRLVLGNVGNFFAVTFIIPFAGLLGGGNDQKGWSLAVGIYSIVAFILLIVAFLDMREKNIENEKVVTIKESLKATKGNWPWVLIVVANLAYWTAFIVRNSSMPYYFQYNMSSKALISFFNGFTIIQVIGMASVPFFVKFMHKWGTTVFFLLMTMVGQAWVGFAGSNVTSALIGWCVACIGSGSACTMFFAMVGDTVDFGEWKTGVRANGFLTAIGASFCIQMGSGFGSFIASMILKGFGFNAANKVQSAGSLSGISFTFVWVPIIIYAISLVLMIVYRKWENHEPVVKADLAERNAKAAKEAKAAQA